MNFTIDFDHPYEEIPWPTYSSEPLRKKYGSRSYTNQITAKVLLICEEELFDGFIPTHGLKTYDLEKLNHFEGDLRFFNAAPKYYPSYSLDSASKAAYYLIHHNPIAHQLIAKCSFVYIIDRIDKDKLKVTCAKDRYNSGNINCHFDYRIVT